MPTLAGFDGRTLAPDISGAVTRGEERGRLGAIEAMTPDLLAAVQSGDMDARNKLIGLNPAALQNMYTADALQSQSIQEQALQAVTSEREAALRNRAQTSMLLEGGVDSLSENIKKWVLAHSGDEDFDVQEAQEISNLSITDPIQAYNMIKAQDAQFQGEIDLADQILGQVDDTRTAAQRDRSALLSDLQSDNKEVRESAAIALGLQGRATGAAPQVVDVGGVPHIFDKQTSTMVPVDVEGRRVTAKTVGESEAGIASDIKAAEGVEQRASSLIERGVTAAESTATIRRALTLLETVETGGPEAISLAVKQRLGIEGADEGELSNSLGKAVLSQLRETFGAAFTENEGLRLERIEANFGRSAATNRRLLEQSLKIAERAAGRARKAAEDRGDTATVQDIDDLLAFTLDVEGDQVSPEASFPTATNPDTGEVVEFRDGQWLPK